MFEALLSEEDAVISDELNHASIIDGTCVRLCCPVSVGMLGFAPGIRLCKAQRKRYKHMDMADLEAHLVATQSCRARLIVTDGVFSMDGDVAPLGTICDLARKCVNHPT